MGELSKGLLSPPSSAVASYTNNKKRNAETQRAQRCALRSAHGRGQFSVSGGFGGGVHTVLGDFVDAAGGRLDALAVEMIERDAAFADGIALFDGFGDVGFSERRSFDERTRGSKLRRNRRCKRAAGSVCALRLDPISDELDHFAAVKENVDGALHVATFDDHGAGAHFDEFARG